MWLLNGGHNGRIFTFDKRINAYKLFVNPPEIWSFGRL
jgi:hypothetical protein